MSRTHLLFALFALLSFGMGQNSAWAEETHLIQIDGQSINPVTADYIIQAIDRAEEAGATCLVIELDTPGGLLSSTRLIVKRMLAARVPLVVYIAPKGSRAGSAGVFISYASHLLAMAPSTNIGAAHPVEMGGQRRPGWLEKRKDELQKKESKKNWTIRGQDQEEPAPKETEDVVAGKILEDTVAFIKGIAAERGRNAEWAEAAVRQSVSVASDEALEQGVIDFIAKDRAALMEQLDGRGVDLGERTVTLRTQQAPLQVIEMDFRQRVLNVLADPNIAYLLLMLGFYGLLFEVTHPGIGVPGVAGVIFLILAFFGMQMLPTNYAGLALMLLGGTLFVAEVMVPGIGLLTLGGLVCMVLGSFILFDAPQELVQVSRSLIFAFSGATAVITLFLVQTALASRRRKKIGGPEGLVDEIGTARTTLSPGKEGKIFVHGELWNAVSEVRIRKGQKVRIVALDGMVIKVERNG